MNDPDDRFSRALFLILIGIGFVFFFAWNSDDAVQSERSVLGRTQPEVNAAPRGKDKDLDVFSEIKTPKVKDDAQK